MTSKLPVLTDYGTQVDDDTAARLRHHVANMLQRRSPSFPGAQPVSFEKKHIQLLCEQEYAAPFMPLAVLLTP
jgi:mRNA guanylyltransferase